MSWIVVALIGYFLASVVALFDKFLLEEKVLPWQYAFYVGVWGIAAVFLIPFFGFTLPGQNALILTVLSGVFFIAALIPLYLLIKRTEVTRAHPIVGALVPVFTLALSFFFLEEFLSGVELVGFGLLTAGGFVIVFERKAMRRVAENIGLALVAAIIFAVSFVMLKAGFDSGAEFLSGYILARGGGFALAIVGLLLFKDRVVGTVRGAGKRIGTQFAWVGIGRIISAVAFLIINYAIFLGSVSLVQAMQGIQYAFLLVIAAIGGLFVHSLRERFSFGVVSLKIVAIILIALGLVFVSANERPPGNPGEVSLYGVTYSTHYIDALELTDEETFTALTDDLGVRHFRLIAYWTEIEPEEGVFDFERLDWLVEQVERVDGTVIMTVGIRVPRYPECHIPTWAEERSVDEQKEQALVKIEEVVRRYRDRDVIRAWQVENEPFLPIATIPGECPRLSTDFLDEEIALVRSLDDRPIIVTDSGEIGRWLPAYRRADIFGTSLYRVVHTGIGYFHHVTPPAFYFVKENLSKLRHGLKPVITIELQAEPWGPEQTYLLDVEERRKSMNLRQLQNNIAFAQRVGHPENYLWGAEWWYWEKLQGYDEFWEEVRPLFEESL